VTRISLEGAALVMGYPVVVDFELLQLEPEEEEGREPKVVGVMGTAQATAGWPTEVTELVRDLVGAMERHLADKLFEESEENDGTGTGRGADDDDNAAPRIFVTAVGTK